MLKSELIKILQEHILQHGDGDVFIEHYEGEHFGSWNESDIRYIYHVEGNSLYGKEDIYLSVSQQEMKPRNYIYKITD